MARREYIQPRASSLRSFHISPVSGTVCASGVVAGVRSEPFVRGRLLSSGEAGRGLTPRCSGLIVSRCAPSSSPLNSISLGHTYGSGSSCRVVHAPTSGTRARSNIITGPAVLLLSEVIASSRGGATLHGTRRVFEAVSECKASSASGPAAPYGSSAFGLVLIVPFVPHSIRFRKRLFVGNRRQGLVRRPFVGQGFRLSGQAGCGLTPRCSGLACARR